MAEKIIYELEIKGTDEELKQLKDLNSEIDLLKQRIKETGDVSSKENEERKVQLKQRQNDYRKLQAQVKDRNKAEEEGVKTLEKMRARLRNLNKELENAEIGSERFKELTERLKELRDEINGADEATGRFQGNVGNYKGAILDAFQQMGANVGQVTRAVEGLGGVVKNATLGVDGLTGAMRLLKVAIAATGIGLLVVALASLAAYFNSTEEGAAKLQKILSPFKILFGNIKDAAADFGEAIIGAFENPKQAVADLWEAIKQNFLNRINGIIKVAKGLGTVLEGVWELDTDKINEGFKDAGTALLDVVTGVEDAATKSTNIIGNFIKDIARETREENEKNIELIDRQLALDKQRRAFLVREAELQTEISEQRLIANDRSKDGFERQQAINAAIELNNTLAAERAAIQQEEVDILKARAEFTDTDAETLNEIAQKEAEIIRLQKTQNDQAREMVSLRETINNELEKELETTKETVGEGLIGPPPDEKFDEWKNEFQKVQKFLEDAQLTSFQKRQKQLDEYLLKGYITEQQYADLTKQLEKEKFNAKLNLASQALGQLAQYAGAETKLGKAAAIAQATINTYLGVSQSLGNYPMPIAAVFAALSLASGIATVQKIVNTKAEVNTGVGRFARGVIGLNGAGSETSDSIPARLSRGESVMTAKATRAFAPVLADMERSVGNTPNFQMGNRRYANGFIPRTDYQSDAERLVKQTIDAITEIPVVVSETDITTTQDRVRDIKVTGDLG